MVKIEAILAAVSEMSPADRAELLKRLLAQSFHGDDDEASVGSRGLASLTESTRHEDWSAYYPASLQNGRGRST